MCSSMSTQSRYHLRTVASVPPLTEDLSESWDGIIRNGHRSMVPSHDDSGHICAEYRFCHMTMFEILLRLTHDCPFANLSRDFSDVKMFLWCNRQYEIMEFVTKEDEDTEHLLKAATEIGVTIEHFSDCGNIHAIIQDCQCNAENSVTVLFDACNLLQISPVVYMEGWEHYRLIAFKQSDVREVMRLLDQRDITYEILRKVPFDGFIASSLTLTADALFSELTDKQIEALLTAYTNGYYQMPRRADIQTISERRRTSSSLQSFLISSSSGRLPNRNGRRSISVGSSSPFLDWKHESSHTNWLRGAIRDQVFLEKHCVEFAAYPDAVI